MLRSIVPVYVRKLTAEFRRRLEHLAALDKAALQTGLHIALDQSLNGLEHEICPHRHHTVVKRACCLVRSYGHILAENDSSGIYVLVYHKGSHTGTLLAVDYRPVDRRRSSILRKQGCVKVDGTQTRHAPDLLRKHTEGYDHK